MPRRKAADRNQPHKSRSRNGCLTCRKRKIRCDEARPVCSNCNAKGLQCLRGVTLKWEAEYAGRGIAFGRCGVWSKNGQHDDLPSLDSSAVHWLPLPEIQPYHFVNSTVDGFEDSLAEQEELGLVPAGQSACSSLSSACTSIPPVWSPSPLLYSPPAFPQLEDSTYAPLLNYYLERLCPLTTPSHRASSPFATLVLPFSVSASSNALNAILALAARHLSKTNRAWKSAAMQLEGKVLRTLRKRLMAEHPESVALDPEVPTIMMMLCLYEIINKCDERWVIHLKGARDLIRTRKRLVAAAPKPSSDLVGFSERFFAYQDVIGRTACGEVPIFGSDYWDSGDQTADAWLGCSPELVSIICSVTELSRLRREDPAASTRASFAIKAEALETRLTDLVQTVADPADDLLCRSAEIKRLATIVYLYCALYGASPTTPLVIVHVRQILRHIAGFIEHGVASGLTWPLFVAAVELDPLQDELWTDERTRRPVYGRRLVLQALDHMAQASIANVSRTRAVVSKVWETREAQEATSSPPSLDVDGLQNCNDWERFVAPLSGNMSLA
ncbi:uncharacterized protein K452DRAFT_324188 [Aplosporella prunicola CBS 121167]|uniref:Zn(2)-C6 fungal-type domain-containing protein n=1 Tax=Aplosporella prunicola CBS 121167 TaxID=1176127 RepID=A0A6A6BQX0_9PEZI|nr:uncharacterized protein K452DRAFT_324188 [Aplosporella prunicola CBS 121167]KAF2146158.1 hypothetical protein K452DRAFT_324188 [Aplosporella prunicola CBS 121167]